jgi:hypothetical protein
MLLLAVLVRAADGNAYALLGEALQELGSLRGDLHRELAGGRDDKEGDSSVGRAALREHRLEGR